MRVPSDSPRRPDNTWGRGHLPLPSKLRHLPRYGDCFRHVIDHRAWPADHTQPETHMLTVPSDTKLSVMAADMQELLRLGLNRVMVNQPGTLSFYFAA